MPPIRSFARRCMDESAFGYPKSCERTFVDLFVENCIADKKAVHDAVVDLAQACARNSDISATHPIMTFAEVQKLTGDGHQPLQHEVAQDEDSSSPSGEEDGAKGPGQHEASASGGSASALASPQSRRTKPRGKITSSRQTPNSHGFHAIIR